MKNLKIFSLFFAVSLSAVVLSSCHKDKVQEIITPTPVVPVDTTDTTGGAGSLDSTFMRWTALVAGNPLSIDTSSIGYTFESGHHIFAGTDVDGNGIAMTLASLEPGSYEIDFDDAVIVYSTPTATYTGGFDPGGNIVITHNDGATISGTFVADLFDFSTASTLHITSGHFVKLSYTP